MPRHGADVAVSVAGVPKFLATTSTLMRHHIFDPLDADVFVYAPYYPRVAREFDGGLFGPRVVAIHREVENISERFRAEAPRWWRASADIQGNWLGCWSPYTGGPRREGSGLCMSYVWKTCLELIRKHEISRGQQYTLVVQTRPDLVWSHPHPPATYFEGSAVWIPEGSDWGGLNDRHAVIERSLLDAYLGSGWEDLVSGAAVRLLMRRLGAKRALNCTPASRGQMSDAPCATHELWMQLRLMTRGVRIRRFHGAADVYRAESGMLECTRGAQLASNTDCLQRVAVAAIKSLGLAKTPEAEAEHWKLLHRWCDLHKKDEMENKPPGTPITPCEPVLVDMLLSAEARRQDRSCAEVVMEFVIENCDPLTLMDSA